MGATDMLKLMVLHPNEFRTLIQYWMWHEPKRDITAKSEHPTSGWDRESMRRCWAFLDATSRSFSAVIKEVDGDLARLICLFYLVLRGLDTIEDDMTIPDDVKQPLLRSFHKTMLQPGWTFSGCGPNEKDRQLLVEFDVVVAEVNSLPDNYREILVDICHKMGVGMADFAHKAYVEGKIGLDSVEDFDLYCHYVAGLVGEGCSRIFAASGKEVSWLAEQLALSNGMGLMLQKTNILRDYREDLDDGRLFWPREIWGAYGFNDPKEMYKEENKQRALWALSGMTLDTLRHAVDSLEYLTLLRNQSVFNFCAIPQTMAMATLALCFMNPDVFQRNVKIRKAEAAKLIMRSSNPRDVAYIFRDYARAIHKKASPSDPNFLKLSITCGQIEQWCEHHYPSFVVLSETGSGFDSDDVRSQIMKLEQKQIAAHEAAKRGETVREFPLGGPKSTMGTGEIMLYVSLLMALFLGLGMAVVYVVMQAAKNE